MKPRIYWTFYPKSRRGYWRVSLAPRPCGSRILSLWRKANMLVADMNIDIENQRQYRAEYNRQLQLRKTT